MQHTSMFVVYAAGHLHCLLAHRSDIVGFHSCSSVFTALYFTYQYFSPNVREGKIFKNAMKVNVFVVNVKGEGGRNNNCM